MWQFRSARGPIICHAAHTDLPGFPSLFSIGCPFRMQTGAKAYLSSMPTNSGDFLYLTWTRQHQYIPLHTTPPYYESSLVSLRAPSANGTIHWEPQSNLWQWWLSMSRLKTLLLLTASWKCSEQGGERHGSHHSRSHQRLTEEIQGSELLTAA